MQQRERERERERWREREREKRKRERERARERERERESEREVSPQHKKPLNPKCLFSIEFFLYRMCVTTIWQHQKPLKPKCLFCIECVLYRMCSLQNVFHATLAKPLNPKCLLHPVFRTLATESTLRFLSPCARAVHARYARPLCTRCAHPKERVREEKEREA